MKTVKLSSMITILVLVLSTFVLSSCEKDDDTSSSSSIPSGLIGTWTLSNKVWSYEFTLNADGTFIRTGNSTHGSATSHVGIFTVSGSTVSCTGAYVSIDLDGEVESVEESRTVVFTYENGVLKSESSGNVWTKRVR